MSKPFEYADGVSGPEPQDAPNVYLPQAAAPPAYDAYVDPAAAHGWQDVYETTETGGAGYPGGVDGTGGTHPGVNAMRAYPDGLGGAGGTGDTRELPAVPERGRTGGGHRARRKPAPRLGRRVAVAAGAVGAVSAVALIAGLSLSGSPSGGTRGGEGGRTGPTAGESPTAESATSGPARASDAPLVAGPGDSDQPSGEASASPSSEGSRTPSASATDSAPPPASGPTSSAPADPLPTASTSAPGRSGQKPGRGPGGTKDPK
ncbi:hypothetical protein ACFV16_05895 [Streptomyces massasporeus]|uniref:hypothetical protein n=1 Tax=Streptomyces massasporeus TaxID=67324 RepID=UPI0036931B57